MDLVTSTLKGHHGEVFLSQGWLVISWGHRIDRGTGA